jgi:predicted rRNA methylase YqxC with S4 and FtsJ domains
MDLVLYLAENNIFPTVGEARKMLQNGYIKLDDKKVDDIYQNLTDGKHKIEIGENRTIYVDVQNKVA